MNVKSETNIVVEKTKEMLNKHAAKICFVGASVAAIATAYHIGTVKGTLNISLYLKSINDDVEDRLITSLTSKK